MNFRSQLMQQPKPDSFFAEKPTILKPLPKKQRFFVFSNLSVISILKIFYFFCKTQATVSNKPLSTQMCEFYFY